jgi:hypothetical protein
MLALSCLKAAPGRDRVPFSDPAQGHRHRPSLLILVGTSLVGALVTWRYAIETKGINLESLGEKG